MQAEIKEKSPMLYARVAGFLYLIIIISGITGEMFIRSKLIVSGDAAATAGNIAAWQAVFRLGFLTDSIMFLCDVALAVLLYVLFKPVNNVAALIAMCFRLAQTAVLALNLLNYHAAVLLLTGPQYLSALGVKQRNVLSSFFLDMHAHGYDLGLLLFALHCFFLGYLVIRSQFLPKPLGVLAVAAGCTYLIGSYTRFLFPDAVAVVSPIYIVAIVSELSLCLWLLVKGVNPRQWKLMAQRSAGAA